LLNFAETRLLFLIGLGAVLRCEPNTLSFFPAKTISASCHLQWSILGGFTLSSLASLDAVDLAVAAAFAVGLAWYLVVRARRRVEAVEIAVDVVARVGRFTAIVARGTLVDMTGVPGLCTSAERALVSLGWDVGPVRFWPVRSAGQAVVYRGRRMPWRDVPSVVGVASLGDGYGGMRDGGDVYVAFYHVGREPDALMAHELTHARLVGVGHGTDTFLFEERRLLAEMRRS